MFLVIFVVWPLLQCNALDFRNTYSVGPVSLSSKASLSYSIDFKKDKISFGLKIVDSAVFSSATATNPWLGFGVSESGMVGADIVTATMLTDQTCNFTDRYVPFAAYPPSEKRTNYSTIYPHADDCQDDDSWALSSCKKDSSGEAVFEFSRSLRAHDGQDFAIPPGPIAVLFAYGSSFEYHGSSRRGARRLSFYTIKDALFENQGVHTTPPDATISQRLQPLHINVSHEEATTSVCSSHLVKTSIGSIVSFTPLIESSVVFEMVLYMCAKGTFFDRYRRPKQCQTAGRTPLDSVSGDCRSIAAIYNRGTEQFTFPENTGIHLSASNVYMILMTTYYNAGLLSNLLDTSGFMLHITPERREHSIGSVTLGDPFITERERLVKNNLTYTYSCPSQCTDLLRGEITVVGAYQSMRLTGRSMGTTLRKGSEHSTTALLDTSFWSGEHSIVRMNAKISPGDSLTTACRYNTTKQPFTQFGRRVIEERCVTVLWYYPVQRVGAEWDSCHYYHVSNKNKNRTVCGSHSELWYSRRNFSNPQLAADGSDTYPLSRRRWVREACKGECLPADGMVLTKRGGMSMEGVMVGDYLHTPEGWSRVVGFTHRSIHAYRRFVRIVTADNRSLDASRGHYIWSKRGYVRAEEVVLGDVVRSVEGECVVRERYWVLKRGLFNPQTENGVMFVNGIAVSCYTDVTGVATGHALMTAWRLGMTVVSGVRAVIGW